MLDGALLHLLKNEIFRATELARVDKIFMPSRDEIVLSLSVKGFSGKLILSAKPNSPRIHFTEYAPENPSSPPMFCMLLRKHLTSGRLIGIRQAGLDRILFLDFNCKNELGDTVLLTLAIEIMGRNSNIIFIKDGKIIDAVRRVDPENSTRFILPGATYELPASQNKINLLENEPKSIIYVLENIDDCDLSKALLTVIDGTSPIVCRELAFLALRGADLRVSELTEEHKERLLFFITKLKNTILADNTPTLVNSTKGLPLDFTYMTVSQYGNKAATKTFDSYSNLLDAFYAERDKAERIRSHSEDLLKLLTNLTERTSRKIGARKADLKSADDREKLREYGELIKANLHNLKNGDPICEAENYYDPHLKTIRIPLDITLSPSANAQKYFKQYKKATTAAQMLNKLIEEAETELAYLNSVFDALSRAKEISELAEIREELTAGGYIKGHKDKKKAVKALPPLEFISSDGFKILVGKNNRQNDIVTFKMAEKSDIWFHVKNMPGSHVVVLTNGKTPPETTLTQAAELAATHSKASIGSLVTVDYTTIKFVKKPPAAKPGMVIYENYKSATVTAAEKEPEGVKI